MLDALWGLQSVCKPPNPGGGTPEKCPPNPDSGRPARDTVVLPFRAILARSAPKCALNAPRRPVRGARGTLGPPECVQTTKPKGWYPRKVPSESRFGPPSPRYGRFSGEMAKFPGLGPWWAHGTAQIAENDQNGPNWAENRMVDAHGCPERVGNLRSLY